MKSIQQIIFIKPITNLTKKNKKLNNKLNNYFKKIKSQNSFHKHKINNYVNCLS